MNKTTVFSAAAAVLATLSIVLPDTAIAGAHTGPPRAQDLLVDPGKRSDITGTVLITGANRGIGLEMARNYAERGWTVIATARNPDRADELNALAADNPGVSVERLDVTSDAEVAALAQKYRDQPIDVLLNNAAWLGDPADQRLGNYNFEVLLGVMDTNVGGPLRLAEAFLDNVARSEQKKIVGITSAQGSLTLIRSDTIQFYNASKTALNMSYRALSFAVRDKGITVALVSPGAVDTDMMALALGGADFQMRLLTPAESAEAVINVIDQYGFDMSGTFISHDGARLPW
ncbi:MAG: SDR family oxidoreductase [Chromatiales bacterium]|nr:SDR family oxidoreductase [Chromatiales bacterium]